MKALLLYPLEVLFALITSIRNYLFDIGVFSSYRSSLPVISVGNIAVGGSGKTPLVILLATEILKDSVILIRGYGGTERGPYLVKAGDSAERVGDEALLILRRTGRPVVVSADRVAGARFVEREKLGSNIILDDGFQHRWLSRDLDIVCIDVSTADAVKMFSQGSLLPRGKLRENRDRALKRANIVVLSSRGPKGGEASAEIRELIPSTLPIFESNVSDVRIVEINDGSELLPTNVVLFSGIAGSSGFKKTAESRGFTVTDSVAFADHHPFSASDIEELQTTYPNIPLVCTEKDAVKIAKFVTGKIYVLEIKTEIEGRGQFEKQARSCLS